MSELVLMDHGISGNLGGHGGVLAFFVLAFKINGHILVHGEYYVFSFDIDFGAVVTEKGCSRGKLVEIRINCSSNARNPGIKTNAT